MVIANVYAINAATHLPQMTANIYCSCIMRGQFPKTNQIKLNNTIPIPERIVADLQRSGTTTTRQTLNFVYDKQSKQESKKKIKTIFIYMCSWGRGNTGKEGKSFSLFCATNRDNLGALRRDTFRFGFRFRVWTRRCCCCCCYTLVNS